MKSADPEAAVTHRRNHRFSPEARQFTTTSSPDGNSHVVVVVFFKKMYLKAFNNDSIGFC